MLVNEWPLFFGMAFHANRIAGRDRPDLTYGGCAVNVVAVTAEQKAFVNAVMIGSGEISLCRDVAAVAEIRLRLYQQVVRFFGVVGGVTVQAANIVTGVR